ncbi:MAG: glycosyltransferase [Candidatus Marinimicrobia bacterium]|nr:glycosyltransferase [Candidatus Neomarinimicrobiota bacterium]
MYDPDSLNILYGVQATGNGHITRSKEVITALKSRGHNVQVILSGRPADQLWDIDSFHPYQVKDGLSFSTENGKVKYFDTLMKAKPLKLLRDVNDFDAIHIDLAIVDYEPLTARIAKKNNIPSVGLGHQYAFDHDVPKKGFNAITRSFMGKFAPVDLGIGLHWHHFGAPILPPILPKLIKTGIAEEKLILVYLPFENIETLLPVFHASEEFNFLVYTSDTEPGNCKNVQLNALSRENFHKDLIRVEGVICNSGFELPSEALSLQKKILVKPLKGQPEQISNSLALEQLNLGATTNRIDPEIIREWYFNQSFEQVIFPDVVPQLVDWIEWGQWDYSSLRSLSRQLWSHSIPVNQSQNLQPKKVTASHAAVPKLQPFL